MQRVTRMLQLVVLCAAALGLAACGSDSLKWSSSTSQDALDTGGGGTTIGVDVRKYEGVAPGYENAW